MNPVIWLPYRSDGGQRDRVYRFVREQVDATGLPVVEADAPGPVFSLARSWNLAARISSELFPGWSHGVMWIADGWLTDPSSLDAALAVDGHVVKAFDDGVWLDEGETLDLIDRGVVPARRTGETSCGVVVVERSVFEDVPQDERFVGHGAEDYAWKAMVEGLYGPFLRVSGSVLALWHRRDKKGSDPYYQARTRNYEMWERVKQVSDMRAHVDEVKERNEFFPVEL